MAAAIALGGAFLSSGGFTTAFGWSVAALLGNQLFAKQTKVQGARLSDLTVQTSEPGQMIPFFYGTVRVAGNIIWATRLKEHVKREEQDGGKGGGGKGGGTVVETFTYTWSGAVLIGEECDQILSLWANEKKIYDYNGGTQKGYTLTKNNTTGAWVGTGLRVYTGTDTQMPDPLIEAAEGVDNTPAYRGRSYFVVQDFLLTAYGNTVPTFTALVKRNIVDVSGVAKDIVQRVQVELSEVDFSELEELTTGGFVIGDRMETRNALDFIGKAYNVEFTEADWKFVGLALKERTSLYTISPEEIDFVDAGTDEGTSIEHTTGQPVEIPYRIELEYIDPTRDWQRNIQHYARQVVESRKKETFSLPMTLNGAQARKIVQTDCVTRWTERKTYSFTLGFGHLHLNPVDVITIPTMAGLKDVRIIKITKQFFGPLMVTAVEHDALAYSQPTLAPPNSNPKPGSEVPEFPLPSYMVSDCHTFRDGDADSYGFYIGMGVNSGKWFNQAQLSSPAIEGAKTAAGGINAINIFSQSVVGVALTELPSASPYFLDTTSELTIDITGGKNGGALNSSTLTQVETDDTNALLVGSEIIQFVTSTYLGVQPSGAKRYKVSNLLRGRLGTEVYIGTHEAGDKVMLLDDTVTRVAVKRWTLGRPATYTLKWGNVGYNYINNVATFTMTVDGWNLKPLAPDPITAKSASAGATQILWRRRTRQLDTFFLNGVAVNESGNGDLRIYAIEIASADGGTVYRTLENVQQEYFVYTAAMQIEDGVASGDEITFRVWRNTSVPTPASPLEEDFEYARGYKGEAVLTLF